MWNDSDMKSHPCFLREFPSCVHLFLDLFILPALDGHLSVLLPPNPAIYRSPRTSVSRHKSLPATEPFLQPASVSNGWQSGFGNKTPWVCILAPPPISPVQLWAICDPASLFGKWEQKHLPRRTVMEATLICEYAHTCLEPHRHPGSAMWGWLL